MVASNQIYCHRKASKVKHHQRGLWKKKITRKRNYKHLKMSNKGKKDSDFHVGSLVFAKLKGFAPWPAKIVRAEKKRYYVYFYGTAEKSPAMKSEDLFDYTKHKAQYLVDKNMKRKFYPEAVEQIEAVLRGEEDVASINNTTSVDESLNATNDVTDEKSQQEDDSETGAEDEENNSTAAVPVPEQAAATVETPVVVSKPENKPPKKSVTKVTKVTPPVPEPPVKPQENETPEPEVVSRSGRKIKSKRYLIDELEETVTPTIKKRAVEISSVDERKSIDTNDASPKKVKLAKPVEQKVEEKQNPEKEKLLQIESHLIELDHLIKASVGLKNANPDKCLEHLNEYKTLEITPLMLKKRPGVVQTMKRLRKYVGNASNWEMDDSMREEFNAKTLKIQLKAEEIYSSFKFLFPHNEEKSFWDHFSEKVGRFQAKTKGMTPDELNNMYEDLPETPPTSPVKEPETETNDETLATE